MSAADARAAAAVAAAGHTSAVWRRVLSIWKRFNPVNPQLDRKTLEIT